MDFGSLTERSPRGSNLTPLLQALAAGAGLLVLTSCGASEPEAPSEPPPKIPALSLDERHGAARRAATDWLDQLEIDPVALTASGERGKKRLGEILSAYLYLLRDGSDPAEQKRIRTRVSGLARQTERPEYHNLQSCGIREFNMNIMSYLRVAWVLERLRWDTTEYRAQLEAIRPKLSSMLTRRSPEARKQFQWYYDYFGWPLPEDVEVPNAAASLVSRRLPVGRYQVASSYALAHEVSIAFRDGSSAEPIPFDQDDLAYLRRILPKLVIRFSAPGQDNTDLLAELLSAMAHLDLRNRPAYQTGIQLILRSQNPDGSWGSQKGKRVRPAADVDTKVYLHTTMVTLRALSQSAESGRSVPAG